MASRQRQARRQRQTGPNNRGARHADADTSASASASGERLSGYALVGREINLEWVDGWRYDAFVVRYVEKDDEYKLVYPYDGGVEVADITRRSWRLLDQRHATQQRPVLVGAVVEFVYPLDGRPYQAMVYAHSDNGEQLKVCYVEDHSTDCIGGLGWTFVTASPCVMPDPNPNPATATQAPPVAVPLGVAVEPKIETVAASSAAAPSRQIVNTAPALSVQPSIMRPTRSRSTRRKPWVP